MTPANIPILFRGLCLIFLLYLSPFVHAQQLPGGQQSYFPVLPVPAYMNKIDASYFAKTCGTEQRMMKYRNDPAFRQRETDMNRAILKASAAASAPLINYTLPVVFHIISNNPAAVTDAQIVAAVQDLNDAFSHTGVYSAGPGANTNISFCLAQKDPTGGNTTGITRTTSYLTDMDEDMEDDRLKNLVDWDPTRYINIWYVTSITKELLPIFQCGAWNRLNEGGYATMPPSSGPLDGIVVSGFGILLPHEMGHYLGLYHTFQGMDCVNNDCSTDGDMVCDTPPQKNIYSSPSCSSPTNSCSTDTLSGFTTDVPDLISNFMSYGNAACINEFTAGQATRMRATIATVRSSLLMNECTPPCGESSVAAFTRSNAYPLPGSTVSFTNTSTGASQFQWSVNNVVVSTATNFSYTFPATGKYAVNLKAYNANVSCYSDYSDDVIVSCGVMARFTPDKQTIASKSPIYLDSIQFSNHSVNATSYKWLLSNGMGMTDSLVGTSSNLTYVFGTPGAYTMVLVATNGACTDTTEAFSIPVLDPTADGTLSLYNVHCYHQDSIQMTLTVCNNGYASLPPGIPISFYDANPYGGQAHRLGSPFLLPDTVKGICCNTAYTVTIDAGTAGINQLFAVFNDNGTTQPLALPNTTFPELNYSNNVASASGFQFALSIGPADTTVFRKQSFPLRLSGNDQETYTATWPAGPGYSLSCQNCSSPQITVYQNTEVHVLGTSEYGCTVNDSVPLHIFPPDLTVQINGTDCYTNDSLLVRFTLCMNNGYDSVVAGIPVSFYEFTPASGAGTPLGPVFNTTAEADGACLSYSQVIKMPHSDSLLAVVNDNGSSGSSGPTLTVPETDYNNDDNVFALTPFRVVIQPADTSVPRSANLPLEAVVTGGLPSQISWTPSADLSCADCLQPVLAPPYTQQYRVVVKNQFNCIDTAYALIKAYTGGAVNIPSAFTPNGDGQNDVFYILGGKSVQAIHHLTIFNRYGSRVFDVSNALPDDPSFGWNGTIQGKNAEAGTYVYMVMITFSDGRDQLFKGTLELIR